MFISVKIARNMIAKFYDQKESAKNSEKFNRRLVGGEDEHNFIDMRKDKYIPWWNYTTAGLIHPLVNPWCSVFERIK
jgi:hypothetical protein